MCIRDRYYPINIVNWKEYPYQPQVSFRIAYTNDAILVHYKVVEAVSYTHLDVYKSQE